MNPCIKSSHTCSPQSLGRGFAHERRMRIRDRISLAAETDSTQPPFHIAFPVRNLEEARRFYGGALGCSEGRSSRRWVDFNLYGHQVVAHVVDDYRADVALNKVDADPVPVPHFGLALTVEQFHELCSRLQAAEVEFELDPHLRFVGKPGEQWTMFLRDPSGNCLEFKAMTNQDNLFAKYVVDE